jgi:hypothetical protein
MMPFFKISFFFLLLSTLSLKTVHAQTNVRVGVIDSLAGVVDVTFDFKIGNAWTFGPQLGYANKDIDTFDVKILSPGLRANYYFNGKALTQGWFLGPSVNYIDLEVSTEDDVYGKLTGNATGFYSTLILGYQWMWKSFNINLGVGPTFYALDKVKVENEDSSYDEEFSGFSGTSASLEFTFGWKF